MNICLLKAALYSSVLNLFFVPISSSIAKIFGYATIIFFVLNLITKNNNSELSKTVLGFIVSIIISFITSCTSLKFESIGVLFNFLFAIVSFIVFYCALSFPVKEQNSFFVEDVFNANYILCGIFILYTFGPFEFKYEIINKYGEKLFNMGLGNPNAVSVYVMFAIIVLLMQLSISVKKYIKIINISLIVILIYVLFRLSSRTAIFCILMSIILYIFKFSKIIDWLSYFILFIPLFMIFLQMIVINNDISFNILNKNLDTGRPELYRIYLETLKDNPEIILCGNLCKYYFINTHNGILTMFMTLGGLGLIIYLNFWNKQLMLLRRICNKNIEKTAFIAIIVFILHSSSESMLVIGTIPYSIFFVIIMRIAKGEIISKYDRITENRI